ncbi:hypothetical protein [Clostridium perfringens]|uniref:hypothetical protein n=1 Tax=Clostridium perfringens TaxID=1502 RepID=UPI0036266902|nr:hypothetical protein [Clostridium perfringens]
MQNFINEKMNKIYADFNKNLDVEKQYCILKRFRFDGNNIPDYNNEIMQQYYLLKYLPAYYAEYYWIYSKIIELKFLNDDFNILSIGCGAGIDLWSIHYAAKSKKLNKKIRYTGYDVINWKYWDDCDEEVYFFHQDISKLLDFNKDKYNIIIFPKSIGEFNLSCFKNLKNCIKRTDFDSEKIIFILSMRNTRAGDDMNRVREIISIMNNKGYKILDDMNKYTVFNKKNNGHPYRINDIIPNLKYPSDILNSMINFYKDCQGYIDNNNKCCEESCKELFTRNPITTMSQVSYKIIKLERME